MAKRAEPITGERINHSAWAAWIFGAVLLVYLMAVAFVLPDPTDSQNKLITFFMALLGALFAFFFIGEVLLKGRIWGMQISAAGGFAVFIIVLKWGDAVDLRSAAGSHVPGLVRKDSQVEEAQKLLSSAGLLEKVPDGVRDEATTRAIRAFQQEGGTTPSGLLSPALLGRMRITAVGHAQNDSGIIAPVSDKMSVGGHNSVAEGGYSIVQSGQRVSVNVYIKATGTKVNTDGRGNVIVALLDANGGEIRSYKHTATFGKNPLKKTGKNANFDEPPLSADEASRLRAGGGIGLIVFIDAQSDEWYDRALREIVTALPKILPGQTINVDGWRLKKIEIEPSIKTPNG